MFNRNGGTGPGRLVNAPTATMSAGEEIVVDLVNDGVEIEIDLRIAIEIEV
jgi:hypothetical protein